MKTEMYIYVYIKARIETHIERRIIHVTRIKISLSVLYLNVLLEGFSVSYRVYLSYGQISLFHRRDTSHDIRYNLMAVVADRQMEYEKRLEMVRHNR